MGRAGETEFSGKAGMVPAENVGHENEVQATWELYATNPASADDIDPTAVGKARSDAVPTAARPGTVGGGGTL
jgi:hypothetical protein